MVIRDLKVRDPENGRFSLDIAGVRLVINFQGILHRRIDRLDIRSPRIFLRPLWGGGRGGAKVMVSPPPFLVESIRVEGGHAILDLKETTVQMDFRMGSTLAQKGGRWSGKINGDLREIHAGTRKERSAGAFPADGSIAGSVGVTGTFQRPFSKDPAYFLEIHGDSLSLLNLNRYLLTPLGIQSRGISCRGEAQGSLRIEGIGRKNLRWEALFSFTDLAFRYKGVNRDLPRQTVEVSSNGFWDRSRDRLDLASLKAALPGLGVWTLRGVVRRISSGNPDLGLHLTGEKISLQGMKNLFPSVTGWTITGNGTADFDITGDPVSPILRGRLAFHGDRIRSEGLSISDCGLSLLARYREGRISVHQVVAEAASAIVPDREGKRVCSVRNIKLRVPNLTIRGRRIRAGRVLFTANRMALSGPGKDGAAQEEILLTGDLSSDLEKEEGRITGIFRTRTIRGISFDTSLNFRKPVLVRGRFQDPDFDLDPLWNFLRRFVPAVQGYTVRGKGSVTVLFQSTFTDGLPIDFHGRTDLKITDGAFSSFDATQAGEGIALALSGEFGYKRPEKVMNFSVQTRASGFELLLGPFYGDFKKREMGLSVAGAYREKKDLLEITKGNFHIRKMGALLFDGRISHITKDPRFHAEITLRELENRRAFDFFIRETFQESFPVLSRLELDGRSSFSLLLQGGREKIEVTGTVQMEDLAVRDPKSGLDLTGARLFLPVDLSYPKAFQRKPVRQYGVFSIRRLNWRTLTFEKVRLFPVIRENSLLFREGITLPLFGGKVVLGDLSYRNLLSPDRTLRFTLTASGMDLSAAGGFLGMPYLTGSLSARIPRAEWKGKSLMTDGEVNLKLFGGEMKIRKISAHDLFTPVASLQSTIECREIDLGRLTGIFEFGRISGILEGEINDLVISNGQPQSFTARIETVRRKGVPQRISVEALEKISVLGSGSSGGILTRGIYRFFKEYRYQKMGFSGRLRNDHFLLKGVEREGRKGYLVKGGLLPPRANVISYTQDISFREMVKRLERIRTIDSGNGPTVR